MTSRLWISRRTHSFCLSPDAFHPFGSTRGTSPSRRLRAAIVLNVPRTDVPGVRSWPARKPLVAAWLPARLRLVRMSVNVWHRQLPVLCAVSAALVVGCGGSDTSIQATVARPAPPAEPRPQTARVDVRAVAPRLVDQCRALGELRTVPVLCPQQLPQGRWTIAHRTLRPGPCEYLLDWNTRPFGSGSAFHLLAGGRCRPFDLRTVGDRWPVSTSRLGALGLIGAKPLRPGQDPSSQERVRLRLLRRVRVASHSALLLRVASYPHGGVHAGHLATVWNQRGAGYVLTLHFATDSDLSAAAQEDAVIAAAASMSDSEH